MKSIMALVNCHITMERSTFLKWNNPLFLGPFSIAMLVYQRITMGYHNHPITYNDSWEDDYWMIIIVWLVVWNMIFIVPYIGNNNPN